MEQGATTVWERWDAILPDGSIHPGTMSPLPGDEGGQDGHMLSFNHYAYGAVIDWVYRNVAGLSPTLDAPGYRRGDRRAEASALDRLGARGDRVGLRRDTDRLAAARTTTSWRSTSSCRSASGGA